ARTVSPRTSYDTCVDVVFVALSTAPVGDLWTPRERRLRSRRTAAACGRGVTTLRYVLRRLGFYWVAAWVSLSLNFVLPRLMPGDPASAMMARFRGQLSPDALDALRAAFGISDAPLYCQIFEYVRHMLTGNMVASIAHFPAPVSDVIATGLIWTVYLAGGAVLVSFCLGTLLGMLAAHRRGGWLDRVLPS